MNSLSILFAITLRLFVTIYSTRVSLRLHIIHMHMLERFRGDRVRSGYGGGSVHLYKYHITMSGAAEQRMGHLQSLLRSWPVLLKGTMIQGDAGNNPRRGGENESFPRVQDPPWSEENVKSAAPPWSEEN